MHYRTLQCNGNITKVEIVMKREEETPLPEVKIVEPDVKLAESVIEISNTATEDILLEVSKDGFKFTMISSISDAFHPRSLFIHYKRKL